MKDNNPANLGKFLKTGVAKDYASPSDDSCRDQTKPFIDNSKQYFPKEEEKKDEEGNVIVGEGPPPIGEIPDLRSQSKLWKFAGINFGEYDVMLL